MHAALARTTTKVMSRMWDSVLVIIKPIFRVVSLWLLETVTAGVIVLIHPGLLDTIIHMYVRKANNLYVVIQKQIS
jgi:hypothetical protein